MGYLVVLGSFIYIPAMPEYPEYQDEVYQNKPNDVEVFTERKAQGI
jgi:hypothetical protein